MVARSKPPSKTHKEAASKVHPGEMVTIFGQTKGFSDDLRDPLNRIRTRVNEPDRFEQQDVVGEAGRRASESFSACFLCTENLSQVATLIGYDGPDLKPLRGLLEELTGERRAGDTSSFECPLFNAAVADQSSPFALPIDILCSVQVSSAQNTPASVILSGSIGFRDTLLLAQNCLGVVIAQTAAAVGILQKIDVGIGLNLACYVRSEPNVANTVGWQSGQKLLRGNAHYFATLSAPS